MADTNDIRFNKPADRLVEAIQVSHRMLDGRELNAHNTYEIACKVLRRRLNIDTFVVKKGKK